MPTMSYSGKGDAPHRLDPWLTTAFIVAAIVGLLVLLLHYYPTSPFTWCAVIAAVVFGVILYFNPRHWLKRRSSACLTFAIACAAAPTIGAQIDLPYLSGFLLKDAPAWLVLVFTTSSILFAWLDLPSAQTRGKRQVSVQLGPGHIIQTGDNSAVTINETPYAPPEPNSGIVAIADLAVAQAKRVGVLETENLQLKSQLLAALQRVEARAKQEGDPQAKAAIEEARRTGDLTQLDAALEAEFARRKAQIKEHASDWFVLCRESAAVALIRGDIDKAQSRLETILAFFPNDIDATHLQGCIHLLRGHLSEAELSSQRVLQLSGDDQQWNAIAYGSLGIIMQHRGDLPGAEAMYRKALEINQKLGRLEGVACQYTNLGIVKNIRGDLHTAEAMHQEALKIDQALGQLQNVATHYRNLGNIKQLRGDLASAEAMYRNALALDEKLGQLTGMATTYNHLGIVLTARGHLAAADAMHRKAIEIDEKLRRPVGMAAHYGNLGIVMRLRGDLDAAEAMHRKALEIHERLGYLAALAGDYGNLGIVMKLRGDFVAAEAMHRKALEIDEKLARPEGMANHYANLGNVMRLRGDLDAAEAMHRNALEIHERLGHLAGLAGDYGNLGTVMQLRGDLAAAEVMHRKALEIDQKLGRPEGIANHYANLGNVMQLRGDLNAAIAMWTNARELFSELGAPHLVLRVQASIEAAQPHPKRGNSSSDTENE